MEAWKDIKGFENYQISTNGRVWSKIKKKYLKGCSNRYGYLRVCLIKNKKQVEKKIHRLVAEAFIPNPENLPEVNHKDENKENNRIENLEWCNRAYNVNYGTRNAKISKQVYQYTIDGKFVKIWPSTKECGRNGFKQGNVAACCRKCYNRGRNDIYKGYKWSYEPL